MRRSPRLEQALDCVDIREAARANRDMLRAFLAVLGVRRADPPDPLDDAMVRQLQRSHRRRLPSGNPFVACPWARVYPRLMAVAPSREASRRRGSSDASSRPADGGLIDFRARVQPPTVTDPKEQRRVFKRRSRV